MDENSPRCLDLLEGFLRALGYARSKSPAGQALEVAAGDGRVTRDLLAHYFGRIDCFDQDMGAVKKLEKLQRRHADQIRKVDQCRMQAYCWDGAYDCIMVRWCSGYIADAELVSFLGEARAHLAKGGAHIIVLDNVTTEEHPIPPRQRPGDPDRAGL